MQEVRLNITTLLTPDALDKALTATLATDNRPICLAIEYGNDDFLETYDSDGIDPDIIELLGERIEQDVRITAVRLIDFSYEDADAFMANVSLASHVKQLTLVGLISVSADTKIQQRFTALLKKSFLTEIAFEESEKATQKFITELRKDLPDSINIFTEDTLVQKQAVEEKKIGQESKTNLTQHNSAGTKPQNKFTHSSTTSVFCLTDYGSRFFDAGITVQAGGNADKATGASENKGKPQNRLLTHSFTSAFTPAGGENGRKFFSPLILMRAGETADKPTDAPKEDESSGMDLS